MKKLICFAALPAVLSACIVVPAHPDHGRGRGYGPAPRAVVVQPAPVVVRPAGPPRYYRGG